MHAKLILCAYMLVRAVNAAAVATNATDMTLHERAIVESGLTQGEATRRSQRYNSREVIRGVRKALSTSERAGSTILESGDFCEPEHEANPRFPPVPIGVPDLEPALRHLDDEARLCGSQLETARLGHRVIDRVLPVPGGQPGKCLRPHPRSDVSSRCAC